MPRSRKAPLFELGGQWIAREAGSPFLHRFWTEPRSGRTRRASLGTADLEDAKRRLAEIVVKGSPATDRTLLSAVLLTYYTEHSDALPSAKHARHAGRLMLRCWGENVRAGDTAEAKQKEFAQWSAKLGHSLSYIARNLTVLSAAKAHSKLDHDFCGKRHIREKWKIATKAPRRVFVPSDDELAAFLSLKLTDDFRRWCIVSLLTGARPEAVLDLSPAQRIRDAGLLELNPEGRAQNKKFRPTVREARALTAWLDCWESVQNVHNSEAGVKTPFKQGLNRVLDAKMQKSAPESMFYCSYASIESVQSAIEGYRGGKNANKESVVNLPRLSAYSFRHKVATVLRQAGRSEDEIALQLGHSREHLRTTAGYGEWAPDYLKGAADALDAWWIKLSAKAAVPMFPPAEPADNVKELRRA